MAPRGRPRKPTALKLLQGTARPSRENPAEPALEFAAMPPPPPGLPKQVADVWVELAPLVDRMRVATAADSPAFRFLAEAVAKARMLWGAKNVYAWSTANNVAQEWLIAFGLTPSQRSKVSTLPGGAKAADPVAEFVRQ